MDCNDKNFLKSAHRKKLNEAKYGHIQQLINGKNYGNLENKELGNNAYNIMNKRHYRSHNRK